MKITIVFHEDAVKECMDDQEITYAHLEARLNKFCNDPFVYINQKINFLKTEIDYSKKFGLFESS